jgi:threonine/homoserine/homoserine lactone efflux protein
VDSQLTAYIAFTTLLVITPGPATAVVVRNTVTGGRRGGIAASLGALAGNATYAMAAFVGLAALMSRVPSVFAALRIGGAIYLGWLGARGLWTAWAPARNLAQPEAAGRVVHGSFTGCAQGLVTNLLNPSIATFYLVALPTFLPAGGASRTRFLLFAAIHVSMAFAFHTTWAVGFHALRPLWTNAAARRTLDTLTGGALLALALTIAL